MSFNELQLQTPIFGPSWSQGDIDWFLLMLNIISIFDNTPPQP